MSQEEALPLPHLDEHRRSFPPRIDAQLQTRGKESGPLAVAVQQVADKFRQGMEDGWEGCWLPVAQVFSDVGARDVSSEGLNEKGSPNQARRSQVPSLDPLDPRLRLFVAS
ncbi:hypothetical protein BHE90_009480 [Fusarium euwallaceae]|uniref:Uncharacterized protein n=1 Tax=Fusarium euwallaceae TaxID=1147111 RepID=A0A430LK39_9HYPO|nr:hypothetical protein BHE90_009480 [Fusarium euwallaceae]